MDDHIENADSSSGAPATRTAFGRREMLQRTGFVVGAAALWATPVVQTIGMRPAAATGHFQLCERGPGTPDGQGNPDQPVILVFEYLPGVPSVDVDHINCDPGENTFNGGAQSDPTLNSGDTGELALSSNGSDTVVSGTPTYLVVTVSNTDVVYTVVNEYGTLTGTIHTSCSVELCIGDRFGSLLLVGAELKTGGRRVGYFPPGV